MNSRIEHYINYAIRRYAQKNLYPIIFCYREYILGEIYFPPDTGFYYRVIHAIKNDDRRALLKILAGDNPAMNIASRIKDIDKNFLIFHQELFNDTRFNPAGNDSHLLRFAASIGNISLFRLCFFDNRFNPAARDNYALENAVDAGYLEIIRLLSTHPQIDLASDDNCALRFAAYYGWFDIVCLLLKDVRINPAALNNKALHWACENGNIRVAELLLNDFRIKKVSYDLFYFAVTKNNPFLVRLICSSAKCHINEKKILYCLNNLELDNAIRTCLKEELAANSWNKFRFFVQYAKSRQIPQDIIKEIGMSFSQLTASDNLN